MYLFFFDYNMFNIICRHPAAEDWAGQGVHVPVHAAEEGGQGDGRPDQRGPRPHALPEGMSTGRRQNMTRRFMIAAEHFVSWGVSYCSAIVSYWLHVWWDFLKKLTRNRSILNFLISIANWWWIMGRSRGIGRLLSWNDFYGPISVTILGWSERLSLLRFYLLPEPHNSSLSGPAPWRLLGLSNTIWKVRPRVHL